MIMLIIDNTNNILHESQAMSKLRYLVPFVQCQDVHRWVGLNLSEDRAKIEILRHHVLETFSPNSRPSLPVPTSSY